MLLDHSSTFLLYFQLLFTQKKKKNQNISQSGYVPHMSSKFCLNSASTFLCNEQTNKQTKNKNKNKKKQQKRIKTMKMKYKSVGDFSWPAGYQIESSHVKWSRGKWSASPRWRLNLKICTASGDTRQKCIAFSSSRTRLAFKDEIWNDVHDPRSQGSRLWGLIVPWY